MIRLDKVNHNLHALLLAASAEVDPARALLDRHLLASLAAGARRINYALDNDEAERLVPVLKILVKRQAKDLTTAQ